MPYCQECGSLLEQGVTICGSCGNTYSESGDAASHEEEAELTPENEADRIESDNSEKTSLEIIENEAEISSEKPVAPDSGETTGQSENIANSAAGPNGFIQQEGRTSGSHRTQFETHLGKGLIKPVAVESSIDGFHFKYDEALRQPVKPETSKPEKIVEFRVSGEAESLREKEAEREAEATIEPEAPVEAEAAKEAPTVEPVMEVVAEPEPEVSEDTGVDQTQADGEIELSKDAPVMEPEPAEAGNSPETEAELLWEGPRTWYGLCRKERYRITDRTVALFDGDGQKITEVEWRIVARICLKQNWWSKLLGIGDLAIIGRNSENLLVLEGIGQPERLRDLLTRLIPDSAPEDFND
ncbi:MAG: PH domain-containing protein [Firmicutes bacterium]|nr:PH domain-containing protein [Bacillota bacterium]